MFVEGEGHLVENGKVKIDGLKSNVQYEFFVYGKSGNDYYNLGVRKLVKGALPEPQEISIALSIVEKKDEKYIQIYYRIDNKQAIRYIEFEINGKSYGTSANSVLIPLDMDSFNALHNLEIQVTISTSEYLEQKKVVFGDLAKECTLTFVVDEINYTVNNFIKNIFVSE